MEQIERMIAEARRWGMEHRLANRRIEALAAVIRENALKDALKALKNEVKSQ